MRSVLIGLFYLLLCRIILNKDAFPVVVVVGLSIVWTYCVFLSVPIHGP